MRVDSVRPRASRRIPAGGMITRRLALGLVLICLSSVLGSCTSFGGFVSDHWPRWAGGIPSDLPPRPGAPGYDEFIAHRQAGNNSAPPAGAAVAANPQATATGNINPQPASAGNAGPRSASTGNPAAADASVVDGGL